MARIVAELGRPETPEETAARKAESSRVYRSSKTFRNLVAALIAILAVVAVVYFIVPRGEPAPRPPIDVGAEATALEASLGREVLVADVPDGWGVNGAAMEGSGVEAWTVVYVPEGDQGFLRVAQGFDAPEAWPAQVLSGARATGTVKIDGVTWDEYRVADPDRAGNISYALSTEAGPDRVLLYGSASPESTARVAEGLTPGIRGLQEESE
jgi:hypothetical protein